jgi:cytochrome c-type biogenesis protein
VLESADLTLWIAFSAGILSFFSPCVLPLVPSYVTYISGLTFAELKEANPGFQVRWTVFLHSLLFVAGFSAIFITLGGLAGFASYSFQAQLREWLGWIQKLGGILIFLFGVHMTGLFRIGALLGEKRIHIASKPAGYIGTFLVGIAFAAGWTPCIGPILGSILALAATSTGGASHGIVMLTAYSAGLGIPFLIAGVLFHGFLSFFNRFRKYIRLVEIITGGLLMVVGVMLFLDLFGLLTGFLFRYIPITG